LQKAQLIEILGDDLSPLEKEIDDSEIEWCGFDEDDFIFLAIALLGINENYFKK